MPDGEWHRRVWRLAGPIILSNITVPLLGAVDTAVVGHLPDAYYLGAVAIGALIFNFLYWGFGFLRMGTTGITAQAHGAGDGDEVRAALGRALIIAFGLALAILVLQGFVLAVAMRLIEASPDVELHARTYFAIRIWGAPAALGNYVVLGWFLGRQNARAGLALQVVINGLNIALDLVFVVGLGLAVSGVAMATLVAEYAGLAFGLTMVTITLRRHGGRWRREAILDVQRLRYMATVNLDIFVRTLCLISAFAYLTAQGARLGDVTLAANAVLMNFVHFMSYGLDGFAHACEALVGRAIGGRDRAAYRGAIKASTSLALWTAAGFTAVYLLFGPMIVDSLTSVSEVRESARDVLPWIVVAPLISVWGYQLDGIFIGAVRSAEMRNSMMASLAVFIIAVMTLKPMFGNHGLWASFLIFMIARLVTLGAYYPRIGRALASRG